MPSLDDLPVRDDLRGQVPYGAPQLDVPVRLNVNENPYAPSEALVADVAAAVADATRTLNRYPDRDARALRADLAAYLGRESGVALTADQVWAANGSNEVMLQLFQTFGGPGRTALGFAPTYSMYPDYCRDTFTRYVTVPRREDFGVDVDAARAAIAEHAPAVVLLASPNNPTGTALPLDTVRAVLDVAPGMVVVDEAYAEFRHASTPSALELLADHPRLVVTRTMSKAFGLAGARLGYLAASPAVVDAVQLVRLPVPPVGGHAGGRAHGARARRRAAGAGRAAARRARRARRLAARARARRRRERRELRAVRPLRRPARRLAGSARPRGPDPGDRSRQLAAGERRHARGERRVPRGVGGGHGMSRFARVQRTTKESDVLVELEVDGTGTTDIETGVPFFDHMLDQLGRHGGLDLTVRTKGDLHIDAHHTVEDTSLAVGQALREALGDKAGIRRFGDALVPLDEALVQCAVDLSGRPYLVHDEPEHRRAHRQLRHHADQAHLRVDRRVGADLPPRPGAVRPQRPPRRRDAVQGVRPRAARRRRARPARGRRTQHEGLVVVP